MPEDRKRILLLLLRAQFNDDESLIPLGEERRAATDYLPRLSTLRCFSSLALRLDHFPPHAYFEPSFYPIRRLISKPCLSTAAFSGGYLPLMKTATVSRRSIE